MKRITVLLLSITSVLFCSCNLDSDNETPIIEKITIDDIILPKGFVISKLYEPTDHEQGSWVSIAKDDKGNFYASDQYGSVYKARINNALRDFNY